mmetsp:Transcript_110795/g.353023  ORF Transcript_110795/g.353023 Transcript_110795/m.353023 type:complete len:334 (-) Transcript_110795:107-1108(-)
MAALAGPCEIEVGCGPSSSSSLPRGGPSPPAGRPRCPRPPPRLAELGAVRVSEELEIVRGKLDQVQQCHANQAALRAEEERRRLAALTRAEEWQRRRQMQEQAITRLQAQWRRLHVVKAVLPCVMDRRSKELLEKGKVDLADSLQTLQRTLHGLVYLEDHRNAAATRIQAWWRGVLGIRVVGVLFIRHKIVEVQMLMERAATLIQASVRGCFARVFTLKLRVSVAERAVQKKEQGQLHRQREALRIQAWMRGVFARTDGDKRRLTLAKELIMKDGLSGAGMGALSSLGAGSLDGGLSEHDRARHGSGGGRRGGGGTHAAGRGGPRRAVAKKRG